MRGTVRKHKTVGWRVQIYAGTTADGKQHRPSKVVHAPQTKKGRAEAEAVLAKMIVEHYGRPDDLAPGAAAGTVAELLDRWIAARGAHWSPKTLADRRRTIRLKILPRIGERPAHEITAAELDELYAHLTASGSEKGGPLAARSVRHVHVTLSSAFTAAVQWREIRSNPARDATPPPILPTDITPPDPVLVARVIRHVSGDARWHAYIWLAAHTGARRSQLLGLRWRDIDLDTGDARFTRGVVLADTGNVVVKGTKKNKPHVAVRLDDVTVAAVRRLRSETAANALALGIPLDPDPFLFASPDTPSGAKELSPEAVKSWWRRLRTAIPELADVRAHDLRHFAGTHLLAGGVDAKTAANRLGHSSPQQLFETYAHLLPSADRAAAAVMTDVMAAAFEEIESGAG